MKKKFSLMLGLSTIIAFCSTLNAQEQARYVSGLALQVWSDYSHDPEFFDNDFHKKDAINGVIEKGNLFFAKSLYNAPTLKKYTPSSQLTLGWIGLLAIKEPGNYVFSFLVSNTSDETKDEGLSLFFLNDRRYTWRHGNGIMSASIQLDAGLYSFALLTATKTAKNRENITIEGSIKEPGKLVARKLTINDFYVPESWTKEAESK